MNQNFFRSRRCAGQLLDYSDLSYDKNLNPTDHGVCYPTDIDGVLEIHSTYHHPLKVSGSIFIFYEYKFDDFPMTHGQEIVLTRAADAICTDESCRAFVVDAKHDIKDTSEDIHAGEAILNRYYDGHQRAWIDLKKPMTVRKFTNRLMESYRCS